MCCDDEVEKAQELWTIALSKATLSNINCPDIAVWTAEMLLAINWPLPPSALSKSMLSAICSANRRGRQNAKRKFLKSEADGEQGSEKIERSTTCKTCLHVGISRSCSVKRKKHEQEKEQDTGETKLLCHMSWWPLRVASTESRTSECNLQDCFRYN